MLVFRRAGLGARADTVAYLIESGFALNGLFGKVLMECPGVDDGVVQGTSSLGEKYAKFYK